jgi:hypothetical protein
MPNVGVVAGSWKERARRAEAEAAAARAQVASKQMLSDARAAKLQRDLEETTESISWRMTAPLRRLNALRRARRRRRR